MAAVPELGVVISSAWRAPPMERLEKVWRESGLVLSWIVGSTPDLSRASGSVPEMLRGLEIRRWLEGHAAGSEGYAIIDDRSTRSRPASRLR